MRVADAPGLPDGLVVDRQGYLYATGPGGVLILTPEGEHIGTIDTSQPTANVTLDADESTLFITANTLLLRVRVR
jgi:gluconolactonase